LNASEVDPGRLVVAALRLDRWSPAEVSECASRALDLGVGGFILFGGEAETVNTLTERLRREAGHDILIGADLERGAGQQFRGLRELPPPAALATLPDALDAAELAGSITARDALSVGVDWVLAPVLDLDAEHTNPIVATRSFGADPARVTALGLRWIQGCQATGALACAKHFPGHGRTKDDSHIGLPVVSAGRETLEADLEPFVAVAGAVATAMVAHVVFPALGSERAATLAAPIVTGLLRDRLGFEGLVATDAMIMGAIGEDDAGAAVDAVRAGCDLVLYPSDVGATIDALSSALVDERVATRVVEAISRIDAAHARSRPGASPQPSIDEVGFARRTIVDATSGLAGWCRSATTSIEAVSDDPDVGPPAGREGPLGEILRRELAQAGWSMTDRPEGPSEQCIVVLAATPKGWKGHGGPSPEVVAKTRSILRAAERGVVVLLGHARWLETLDVPGLCAWSTETVMERAVGRWIDEAVRG